MRIGNAKDYDNQTERGEELETETLCWGERLVQWRYTNCFLVLQWGQRLESVRIDFQVYHSNFRIIAKLFSEVQKGLQNVKVLKKNHKEFLYISDKITLYKIGVWNNFTAKWLTASSSSHNQRPGVQIPAKELFIIT